MSVDLSGIVDLTAQLTALQQAASSTVDPSAKAILQAQISIISAQLSAKAQHAQAQADASSNILENLGLFSTLTTAVGANAPSIIALFKR